MVYNMFSPFFDITLSQSHGLLWEHGIASLTLFLGNLNSMDKAGRTNCTNKIASGTGLKLLDLKLKIFEGKIRVDIFAKPTNTFSYTTPNTYHSMKNIWNIPKGVALKLDAIKYH